MNLLPKTTEDFSKKEFWERFFAKRGKKAFEWYGEYPELCEQIDKYIKYKDDILMIGCGNSKLGIDMFDMGYRNITNIDISHVVIRQMNDSNKGTRPDLKFLQMDALNMSFPPQTFSVVLDKGTLDALMPNDSPETLAQIDKLFSEIDRVLRTGGRYFCVSLLQEHILQQLLSYFPKNNWMFRVIRCHEVEKKTIDIGERALPVFVVICFKFNALPAMILEACLAGDKMQRLNTQIELINSVKSVQESALILSGLNRNELGPEEEVSFDLYAPTDPDHPRFSIYVLDWVCPKATGKYAAFIVPNGRETEWLFSTKEGRKKLLEKAGFNRLAIVTMHRGQIYTNLDAVKQEITESIRNMAPPNLKETTPYLSLNSEVGIRELKHEGQSEISGPYVIEDIALETGELLRRLTFLNNKNIVQSEAKLKSFKIKKKSKLKVDPSYLACQHHVYMVLGTYFVCSKEAASSNIAIIGLGGGGLVTFLNNLPLALSITAVDIDESMVYVAQTWFGLQQNARLKINIEDGLGFLQNAALTGTNYKAILFDVDNKDATLGLSCPPSEFLQESVYKNVVKCIGSKGIFILNLVLRNETLREPIFGGLKMKFKSIISYKLQDDLNEIVFCKLQQCNLDKWKMDMKSAAEQLNKIVGAQMGGDFVDLDAIDALIKLH